MGTVSKAVTVGVPCPGLCKRLHGHLGMGEGGRVQKVTTKVTSPDLRVQKSPLRGYITRFAGTEVTTERLHDQVCGYRKSPLRGCMASLFGTESHQ